MNHARMLSVVEKTARKLKARPPEEKDKASARCDKAEKQAKMELDVLDSNMRWLVRENYGYIYPDEEEAGSLEMIEACIGFTWREESNAMEYDASLQTCMECGNTSWMGRKKFETLHEAVDWVEEEIRSVAEGLATRLGMKLV